MICTVISGASGYGSSSMPVLAQLCDDDAPLQEMAADSGTASQEMQACSSWCTLCIVHLTCQTCGYLGACCCTCVAREHRFLMDQTAPPCARGARPCQPLQDHSHKASEEDLFAMRRLSFMAIQFEAVCCTMQFREFLLLHRLRGATLPSGFLYGCCPYLTQATTR